MRAGIKDFRQNLTTFCRVGKWKNSVGIFSPVFVILNRGWVIYIIAWIRGESLVSHNSGGTCVSADLVVVLFILQMVRSTGGVTDFQWNCDAFSFPHIVISISLQVCVPVKLMTPPAYKPHSFD